MSQRAIVDSLRRHLNQLAEDFDTGLSQRYALQFWTPEKPSLYRRLRKNAGRLLRWLGLMRQPPAPPPPPPPPEPWLTELRHVDYSNSAKPLLLWAMDIDRDELRSACTSIRKLQAGSPGWAPVLVTNIADFAFFSRLNWLVEYVPSLSAPADGYPGRRLRYLAWLYRIMPSLSAPADGYSGRKLRYLAWRYRDVPALSVTTDIKEDMLLEDLLVD